MIPKKAVRTQVENQRAVFGAAPLTWLRPQHVYQYADKRKATRVAANRAIDVLSHAFTRTVMWGYMDRHPFKGEVRLEGEKPRERYVDDWELIECLALASKRKKGSVLVLQAYIRIKLLTGLRRGDLLRLTSAAMQQDEIHVTPSKTQGSTGKRVIIEWPPELTQAVATAKAVRPVDISPWLFCTRKGEGYFNEDKGTASGWDSMWQRFMDEFWPRPTSREGSPSTTCARSARVMPSRWNMPARCSRMPIVSSRSGCIDGGQSV